MNVTCKNCRRNFDLDEQRLGGVQALMCDCGQKLWIQGKPKEEQLGKYLLLHKIATGGMGEIFYGKVSGIEGFEREVAIKKMLPHLNADRSFVDMMVKEAKLTVLLNHPSIVQIYDLSKDGDQYYIAMEYVPGVTISTILRDRIKDNDKLPVCFCVHATLEIIRGLHYAANLITPDGDKLSIVHRDITPQNILVTRRGGVKITDFGIAKAANEISTTATGIIKGKLGYMAPEQLAGKSTDHRIDLYCAAIMLWEMLAGRRLFKGTSEVDTFRLVAEAKIPPLSEFRSDVDERLMQVISRALLVDPDARYQQGSDFAAALQQAIFPQTADSYARDSEAWLQANAHLFKDVYVHHDDKSSRDRAMPDALEPATKFTRIVARPSKGPNYALWGGGAVAAAALALGGGWLLRSQPPSVTSATVQNSFAPAPVGSAPGTAVSPNAAPPSVPSAPSTASAATAAAPSPQVPATAAAAPAPAPPPAAVTGAPASAPAAAAATEAAAAAQSPEAKAQARRDKAAARARTLAKQPLTGAEIQHSIAEHQGAIVRCLRDLDPATRPPQVAAKMTIETSGQVSKVVVAPALPEPQAGCLQQAMRAIVFRRHPSEGLEVTIPLRLQAL